MNLFKQIFLLLTIVLLFTQCKSVKVSILGVPLAKQNIQESKSITQIQPKIIDSSTTLFGSVTDKKNRSIPDAGIYILKDTSLAFYTKSDSLGNYNIPNFQHYVFINEVNDTTTKKVTKDYIISIVANGYRRVEKSVDMKSMNELTSSFILDKLCSVSGNILLNNQIPVSNAILIFTKNSNGSFYTTETNHLGYFSINDLENGQYTISVQHSRYSFPTKLIELKDGMDYNNLQIMSFSGTISGDIKEKGTNNRIENVIISIQKKDIDVSNTYQPIILADTIKNISSFEFMALPAGRYNIQVKAKGYGQIDKDIELTESQMFQQLKFNLVKEGMIVGKIDNCDSLSKVSFILFDSSFHSQTINNFSGDKLGNYVLNGIASGVYNVTLKYEEFFLSHNLVKVQSEHQTKIKNFNLSKSTQFISGKVVDALTKQPLKNVIIRAYNNNSAYFSMSDENGDYKIIGLDLSSYNLMVFANNYLPPPSLKKIVAKKAGIKNVDFYLTKL